MLPEIGRSSSLQAVGGSSRRPREAWAVNEFPTKEVDSVFCGKWLDQSNSTLPGANGPFDHWDAPDVADNLDMSRKAFSLATGPVWQSNVPSPRNEAVSKKDAVSRRNLRLAPLKHVSAADSAGWACDDFDLSHAIDDALESPEWHCRVSQAQGHDTRDEQQMMAPAALLLPRRPPGCKPSRGRFCSSRWLQQAQQHDKAYHTDIEDTHDLEAHDEAGGANNLVPDKNKHFNLRRYQWLLKDLRDDSKAAPEVEAAVMLAEIKQIFA